jgi:hypothetical protein
MHLQVLAVLAGLAATLHATPINLSPRKSINDCSESTFENQWVEDDSPLVSDCKALAVNIAG